MVKIALIQSPLIWGNVEANWEQFGRKLSTPDGVDMIVLPEMFTSGCMMVKKAPEVAMAEKVRVASAFAGTQRRMLEWAAMQNALVMGSTVYEEEGHFYNRLIVAFPDGDTLYYDKRHCFRMGGENEHFTAGGKHLVFEFRGMKMAVFICYDLRFPVWSRNVQEYDLAVYVANWPQSRRDVWRTLLKARAIENQAFVAGVNCVGTDADGLIYSGDSMVVDARGHLLAEALPGEEKVIVAELDFEQLKQFRTKFPVLKDGDHFILG